MSAPANQADEVIVTTGLVKRYGEVTALDGLDLSVPAGHVLGLLGPNGAGKTTAVRILTTLLPPDGGSARVAGIDVVDKPGEVRKRIGLSGQYAAVDENLTGFENLDMIGRLYRLGRGPSKDRAHRAARAVRAHRGRRPPGEDLLGGHAAPPRPRRGAGGQAHRAVPRRADHRSRPERPGRHVGRHPRAGEPRHHAAADHPVHGGGRSAGRRDRGDRPRPVHRPGHLRPVEGAARRRADRDRGRDQVRHPRGPPGAGRLLGRRCPRRRPQPHAHGPGLRRRQRPHEGAARARHAGDRTLRRRAAPPHPRRRVPHPHRAQDGRGGRRGAEDAPKKRSRRRAAEAADTAGADEPQEVLR